MCTCIFKECLAATMDCKLELMMSLVFSIVIHYIKSHKGLVFSSQNLATSATSTDILVQLPIFFLQYWQRQRQPDNFATAKEVR